MVLITCPYCKEKDCVRIIVETYNTTIPNIIQHEYTEEIGFDLVDHRRGEVIGISELWQDIRFECDECYEIFKFKHNVTREAYNEITYFNEIESKALKYGHKKYFRKA